MTEATRLVISEACRREGIKLYPDTEFVNTAPGVYEFINYLPNQRPERRRAVIKGLSANIYYA